MSLVLGVAMPPRDVVEVAEARIRRARAAGVLPLRLGGQPIALARIEPVQSLDELMRVIPRHLLDRMIVPNEMRRIVPHHRAPLGLSHLSGLELEWPVDGDRMNGLHVERRVGSHVEVPGWD